MKTSMVPLLAILAFLSSMATAQPQSFQSFFDRTLHNDGVVGAAYLLLDKGHTTESHTVGTADEAYDYRSCACVGNSGLATTGRTGSKNQPRPFDVTFLILWK